MGAKRVYLSASLFGVALCACAPRVAPPRHAQTFVDGSLAMVASRRVAINRQSDELAEGLPFGSLSTDATILRNRATEICFAVVVRQRGSAVAWTDPEAWRMSLASEGRTEPPATITPSKTRVLNTGVDAQQGPKEAERIHCANYDIRESRCAAYDISVRKERVFEGKPESKRVPVVEAGGTFCFANVGLITSLTKHLVLHVETDPVPNAPNDFFFEWTSK